MTSKYCSKCKETKELHMFSKQSSNKSGYRSQCKSCISTHQKQNHEYLSAYYKNYREQNKEKVLDTKRKYREANKEKIKASQKRYREANKEKAAEYQKEYRLRTTEQRKIYKKTYTEKNKKALLESAKRYRKENPLVIKRNNLNRRVAKLSNGVYKIFEKEIKNLYKSKCFYCGSDKDIQMDHVIPISKGGTHSIGNIVPACRNCNLSKRDKFIVEWKKQNEIL